MPDDIEETLRRTYLRYADEAPVPSVPPPKARAVEPRGWQRLSVPVIVVAVVGLAAGGVVLSKIQRTTPAGAGPSVAVTVTASPDRNGQAPTTPIAVARYKDLELEVLAVDRTVSSDTPGLAAGCVSVTFQLRNVGAEPYPIPGESLFEIYLQDQYGPDTESADSEAPQHVASNRYLACPATPPTSSPPITEVPAGDNSSIPAPADTTLQHGTVSKPITLYFTIKGPTTQKLIIHWTFDGVIGLPPGFDAAPLTLPQ